MFGLQDVPGGPENWQPCMHRGVIECGWNASFGVEEPGNLTVLPGILQMIGQQKKKKSSRYVLSLSFLVYLIGRGPGIAEKSRSPRVFAVFVRAASHSNVCCNGVMH